jgi:hypothetical protein
MLGGSRPGAGRKPVSIDLVGLEKLAMIGSTNSEMAAWFNCSEKTIETRRKDPEFEAVIARGRGKGRVSLRRLQMRLAERSPAMAIWLGKVILGQRDGATETASAKGDPEKKDCTWRPTVEIIDAILEGRMSISSLGSDAVEYFERQGFITKTS